jgi:hypothetical protein
MGRFLRVVETEIHFWFRAPTINVYEVALVGFMLISFCDVGRSTERRAKQQRKHVRFF